MAEPAGEGAGPAPVIRELFPVLAVQGAARALAFYREVFGARETLCMEYPDGRVAHAEMAFGPATVMLADEHPDLGFLSPLARGGAPVLLHLHVDDVDDLTRRAVRAGATVIREPEDQGHGERQALIRDPFGHEWLLGHEIEVPSAG
jgi:PhnB protein